MERSRHLVSSEDWSLTEIQETLDLARRLREGDEPQWVKGCLAGATVTVFLNTTSTRSRAFWHFAAAEMGGVPLVLEEQAIHRGEDWEELCTTLVQAKGAICVRLLPTDGLPYGTGEGLLRRMASLSDAVGDLGPAVISMSHDRCHPCQGLSELLTYREATGGDLRGKRILFAWMRGKRDAPASPTQDSLMMMTRVGMKVTLCYPPGCGLDGDVMNVCRRNARQSGGEIELTGDLEKASRGQDLIYARHWGAAAVSDAASKWYCDDALLGDAKFVHPMPVDRGIEVAGAIVDGPRSLTRELIRNKRFVQKAVLARLARVRAV